MAAWSLPNRTLLTEPEPHHLPWNSPRPESRSKLVKRRGEAPWNGRRPSWPGNVWTWCSDPLRSTRPPSTLLFTMSRGFPTKQTTLTAVHPSQLRPGGNLLIWLPRSLSKKKKNWLPRKPPPTKVPGTWTPCWPPAHSFWTLAPPSPIGLHLHLRRSPTPPTLTR